MLQFNLNRYKPKFKNYIRDIICIAIGIMYCAEFYYTKKYKYPEYKEATYQNHLEELSHPEFKLKKSNKMIFFKWGAPLEKRIHVLSLKLNLTKLVFKPKYILLYGQTFDINSLNQFWKLLKLDNHHQEIELLRWKKTNSDRLLKNWSYIVRIGF